MSPHALRVLPLMAGTRRSTATTAPAPERRAAYELARLRVATTHDPPARFAHLARRYD